MLPNAKFGRCLYPMYFLPDLPSPTAYVRAPTMPGQLDTSHQFKSTQTICYQPMRDLRFAPLCMNTTMCSTRTTAVTIETLGPSRPSSNMGPVEPPQRKGHLPQYARNQLVELQNKFNEQESMGVFVRPGDVHITVEYINPLFLVKKRNGGFRLVTTFTDVGRYSKPQLALVPDVDSTLRKIAQWKHIISIDLSNAFYQIPLSHNSMKYCGVVTPFRGVRVYARCAMAMPGSETALDELLCRVLEDLLEERVVAKLADDIYCGEYTITELQRNYKRLLQCLANTGLRLSAAKTTICPSSTVILGWV